MSKRREKVVPRDPTSDAWTEIGAAVFGMMAAFPSVNRAFQAGFTGAMGVTRAKADPERAAKRFVAALRGLATAIEPTPAELAAEASARRPAPKRGKKKAVRRSSLADTPLIDKRPRRPTSDRTGRRAR